MQNNVLDKEISAVVALFSEKEPTEFKTINSSKGDADFRETIIVCFADHSKLVVKLAHNDFTCPERIKMWQKAAETYREIGYYCPAIFSDSHGSFPTVCYKGHNCVVYAEEYAPYSSAETVCSEYEIAEEYERNAWVMTARIAAEHFNYTEYPSAYCLYDVFCDSDETDEVLENAKRWIEYAKTLPAETQEQVERIWQLWEANRMALEPLYRTLPTSVFQADLNKTNILLNDKGQFIGLYDFNLCGKEVFLNYLFRETFCEDFEEERQKLYQRLELVSRYYRFLPCEKEAVLLLYRCLKPLWYNKLGVLKLCGSDVSTIIEHLNQTERALTESFDFAKFMG